MTGARVVNVVNKYSGEEKYDPPAWIFPIIAAINS